MWRPPKLGHMSPKLGGSHEFTRVISLMHTMRSVCFSTHSLNFTMHSCIHSKLTLYFFLLTCMPCASLHPSSHSLSSPFTHSCAFKLTLTLSHLTTPPHIHLDSILILFMRPSFSLRYAPPLAIYWRLAMGYFVGS
jgi:hypothetical protein